MGSFKIKIPKMAIEHFTSFPYVEITSVEESKKVNELVCLEMRLLKTNEKNLPFYKKKIKTLSDNISSKISKSNARSDFHLNHLETAEVQLANQYNRTLNLELMLKYGKGVWRSHNR